MTSDKLINAILNKCDVYFGDSDISKETILEKYLEFFAHSLVAKEHSVNFALHTGSICFDIVSIIAVTLGCLSYNLSTNEDVISSLRIDDMVLFNGQRYRWKGTTIRDKMSYIVLEQDGTGRNGKSTLYAPYEKNKHLIKPYYGESHATGARGVKMSKNNREEFLSYAFEVPVSEIPAEIDVSIVIVSERDYFLEIAKQVSLRYGENKKIGLLDIVPASYFTNSGEEYQLGLNPTKAEPVLKITSRMSAARDLILDKHSNKVVGLLVLNGISLTESGSELADLLRRKTLRFAHVTSPFKAGIGEHILELYEDASLFACTKKFLEQGRNPVRHRNPLTAELHRQIANIINNDVIPTKLSGGWQWPEYFSLRNLLLSVKQSNLQMERREDFIVTAHGLLNLLNTAIFSMDAMEQAIADGKINPLVISPRKRIDTLWEIVEESASLQDLLFPIVSGIEDKYTEYIEATPKATALYSFLQQHHESRLAIVVPKAYYANLLALVYPEPFENGQIDCVTANRFDYKTEYDYVLVVGNIHSERFDPMQCLNAPNIVVFLYDCEEKIFSHKKNHKKTFEQALNKKIGLDVPNDEIISEDEDETQLVEKHIQEVSELDTYIMEMNLFDVHKLASSSASLGESSTVSEVTHIGAFTTGEQIFFSKFYNAVVFDMNAETVEEKKVDKLLPGDVLVFLKRDGYTQNIVDFIYEKLLRMGRLGNESVNLYEKSLYWKEALREYKEKNGFSYRKVAKNLRNLGSSLQEVTVRQWMIEDSHIVGPRSEKTMEYIAQLTQDPYLLQDIHGYYEACSMVRHERRTILGLISKAIREKLRGHIPEAGSALEVVYENVESLAETLELSYISQLESTENISINLVNKPITETEALM